MTEPRIQVLLVEDEPVFAGLLRDELQEASSGQFALTHATCLRETLQRLGAETYEAVLLDLSLPDREGLDTYRSVKQMAPGVPVIVLTGLDDETLALQAVREGAQDYLVKGQFNYHTLGRVARYAIERKRAERAMRQSEEFFRLISENVTDLIAVLDRTGKRLYNSPSYAAVLGHPGNLLGTDSFADIHPEDRERIKDVFHSTVTTGIGQRAEYRFLLKDGQVRFVESVGSAIRDETGAVSKVVVISRDITERRRNEQALRQALTDLERSHAALEAAQAQLVASERFEAVSTFAQGIAHEVRNPLQTIVFGVNYLSQYADLQDADTAMLLTHMRQAVHRAEGVIRGLVEFSSPRNSELKGQDLSEIIEQALRASEAELAAKRVRLTSDLDANLPPVNANQRVLKHLFISLFTSVLQRLPPEGELKVRSSSRKIADMTGLPARLVGWVQPGDWLVVAEVEDSSPTSLKEQLARIGSPTTSPAADGTESGFGFLVLKKMIQLCNGAFDVQDRDGGGNQYSIIFKSTGQPQNEKETHTHN